MKNIILFTTILLFTLSSFAQSKTIDENITQLMYAKHGLVGVESIADKMAQGISDESRKSSFLTEMLSLRAQFIPNAITEIKKEYSNEDIIAIYNEFTSDKLVYEDRTVNFFSKFRAIKGQYFKRVKELFVEYK